MTLPRSVLLGFAIGLSITATAVRADDDTTRWALIFAPGDYTTLVDSQVHAAGASQLKQRLLKSGFADDHIRVLTGGAARPADLATADNFADELSRLANQVRSSDVLLVAVLSTGSSRPDVDGVAAVDCTPNDLRAFSDSRHAVIPNTIVTLADVVATMSTAATRRQILLVDGHSQGNRSAGAGRSVEFGSAALRLRSGQCVLLNRSNALRGATTEFIASVCDSLSDYADGNRDGLISQLEFVDHVQKFAEATGNRPATVQGNLSQDFNLAIASESDGDTRFSREQRDRLALTLLKWARNLLLVERDGDAARQALERAATYRPSAAIRDEAIGLLLTLAASHGDFDRAWNESAAIGRPLLFLASTSLEIRTGDEGIGTIQPGELVLFSERENEWVHPKKRFRATFVNGSVEFTELEVPNGWVDSETIRPVNLTSSARNDSLTATLRLLNGGSHRGRHVGQRQVTRSSN